ncbi:MAG: translesion error-prone DNA polymerase V autoproteolytic subunit [Bacteroidales bacterium]|nr:translesion error-prone DNA polymerase V autoproteolytic subunit [Bacteroidales bacterium]MBR5780765.1 translesion error-prone DNA polymerase V autoproteolytic subunit [Bacteroidales bacterium]
MNNDLKLDLYSSDFLSEDRNISFIDTVIKAGFPSPAQDYISGTIDLNRELIRHKETTFLARVSGNSLQDAGICDGDIIVIDKSLEAKNGDFVVAFVDGEFTLKEFRFDEAENCAWLIPHNKDYEPIKVTEENEFLVWGVLTYTIKQLRK